MAIDLITGHQGQMHISADQVANLNNSLLNGAGDHKVLRLIDGTVSFTGLIVSVANGYWRVNGYDMEIYEEEVVNIDPSSTGTSRIDKVFVEILQDIPSGIQRSELVVVKGEESAGTPVAPDAPTDPVLNTDLLLQCEEVCIVTVTEGAMTISDSTEEYTTVTPAELAIVEGKANQAILDAAAAQGTANTASTNAGYALQMIKKSSDAYSNTKAYKVGDCVIQNNTVYKCHTPCSAASWAVNSSCFTATSLTESVTELNSSLSKGFALIGSKTGVSSITFSSSDYKLLIALIYTSSYAVPIVIPCAALSSSERAYISGMPGTYGGVSVVLHVTNNYINIVSVYNNGNDVTSSAAIYLYGI